MNGQNTVLISPAIDIGGAESIIGQWDMWVNVPGASHDRYDLWLSSGDDPECVADLESFVDEKPGSWYGGPYWQTYTDDWTAFAGNEWLRIMWKEWNEEPAPAWAHGTGIFLDRQRVGVITGEPETAWDYSVWTRFNDRFVEEMNEALLDTAVVRISDVDGIASATLMATNDQGTSWQAYPMRKPYADVNDWYAPPPVGQIEPRSEIWYYFEATDSTGNTSVRPRGAPDSFYEFSILPLVATVSDPGILLVDKHGRSVPGEQRRWRHTSEYYYREALDILGHECEIYDVEVPSGSNDQSDGPDSCGYKYYDTQIWWTNDFNAYTIKIVDQFNLIRWLSQSPQRERNFILTGNDIGYDLVQAGADSHHLYEVWLGVDYLMNTFSPIDTIPTLRPAPADWGEWACLLSGG